MRFFGWLRSLLEHGDVHPTMPWFLRFISWSTIQVQGGAQVPTSYEKKHWCDHLLTHQLSYHLGVPGPLENPCLFEPKKVVVTLPRPRHEMRAARILRAARKYLSQQSLSYSCMRDINFNRWCRFWHHHRPGQLCWSSWFVDFLLWWFRPLRFTIQLLGGS